MTKTGTNTETTARTDRRVNVSVETINTGLEGVTVAATTISDVRGREGDLRYRGQSIDYWVEQDFASAAAAILDLAGLGIDLDLGALLFAAGKLSPAEMELVLSFMASSCTIHPMRSLQSIVPLLDVHKADELAEANGWVDARQREALVGVVIAAKLPQIVATLASGLPQVSNYPDEPDYITRFLLMLGIDAPTPLQLRALSVTQILQLEHSLNAGTFTARVIASTQASMAAAVSGAFGALSGKLHGGADQAAIEMADEVGDPAAAKEFVLRALADGVKVMGMGHREYKVVDPRAVHVKALAKAISQDTEHARTYSTLEAVEAAFTEEMFLKNKALHANLEFYKGVVYRSLGVSDRSFTALFAMARVFGYIAHVLEGRIDSRIIRPAARYVGK